MGVPTIALYASPPSSVCSTPHPCQINSSATYDFELNPRPASSSSASTPQKAPIVGGLSCLFSSSSVRQSSSSSFTCAGDDIASLRHDRGEELGSSFCYSSYPSLKCGDQSPVSVFQGPVSCGSVGIGGGGGGSARSPPIKILRDRSNDFAGSFRAGRDALFNGFVRNALGCCIDYDSPSFPMPAVYGFDENSSNDSADEFQFNLEDNLVETEITPDRNAKKLLLDAQLRHKIFYDEFVIKAFYEAEKAHRGQMRASGDPYLQHCVETAVLLATVGANSTVVAAGLMHDTVDDSFTSLDHIRERLGDGVADLVEGVSKMSQLSKLARENDTAHKTVEADRLHTMFLAMVDARAVLIKLADRLHNMRTLGALAMVKQQRFAKETLEIFVPLANRLGISSWKEQLENLCFEHLNPVQHKELSSKLVKSFDEATITSAIEKLEGALKDGGVSYHVLCGRHKSLYSIYRKMLKKKLNMDEIHDMHGLRLVVENDEDCYTALRIIHQLWPEVPGKLKDYINHPKFNGYQSLHTVVMGEDMVPFEVQIRTKEMHLQAEFGFAAHWRYKEGDCKHSSFVLQMVEWARWVITWQCETMELSSFGNAKSIRPPCPFPSHSADCPYLCSPQCDHDGPIFVIVMENEKMSVQEFPANSTVMDLLEKVGCGNLRGSPYRFPVKEELRPRLNHKPVNDLGCKLKMGDVVELTPTISDKSLTEYREEIQRMYNRGGFQVSTVVAPS